MKLLFALVLSVGSAFLIAPSAFASTPGYELKMELSLNGKHISSPEVITKAGELASFTEDTNGGTIYMDVIATEKPTKSNNAILMKFVIGKILPSGERTIISSPRVISLENSKAEIFVGEGRHEDLSLSVVATRKEL